MGLRKKFLFTLIFPVWLITRTAIGATPTPTFTLLSDAGDTNPVVELGDSVRLRISGLDTDLSKAKIEFRLGGSVLSGPYQWNPSRSLLTFSLERNDANAILWSRLLGAPFSRPKQIKLPVDLEINGQALGYQPDKTDDSQAPTPDISLIRYNTLSASLGMLAVILVLILAVYSCRTTAMMRDASIPQLRPEDRPYSLNRFQMVFWFSVIFAAFVFILFITNSIHSLTTESFLLLGIPSATTLAGMAVDQSKSSPYSRIEANLMTIGLTTLDDVKRLYGALRDSPDGAAPARDVLPKVNLPDNPKPSLKQLCDAYEAEIRHVRSCGFWEDLTTDINGATIHRWQMLIWTIAVGCIYLWRSYANLTMPILGNELLALMGVSSAAYVGIKIPERQS